MSPEPDERAPDHREPPDLDAGDPLPDHREPRDLASSPPSFRPPLSRRALLKRAGLLSAAAALLVGGVGTSMGVAIARRGSNRYYEGPVRDNFDGVAFRNLEGADTNGLREVLRWRLEGERTEWPTWNPSPFEDLPPQRVGGADLRISFVGHASFLLQAGGVNVLLDPVWSERASPFARVGPRRVNAPGIPFEALPPVDAIFLSHNHYDHLDSRSLEALLQRRGETRIFAPLGNDAVIQSRIRGAPVQVADWGDAFEVAPNFMAHLEPSVHWSARGISDRRHALWGSWVFETPAGRVLFIGDTGFGEGASFRHIAARHPGIRVALLPIGAYEPRWFMQGQHVNPEEAAQALGLLGAEVALGHHWGTYQLTDEGILAPVEALAEARAARGWSEDRFRALRPGEVWEG